MDFLIPTPPRIKAEVHITQLLHDLGFIPDFHGEGYVRLNHPELMVDFLVAGKGRGLDKPYPIKALGISAQPLRFLSLLSDRTIVMRTHGVNLRMPHPVNLGLHKLIISNRRARDAKRTKDRIQGVEVLRAFIASGNVSEVRKTFDALPPKWRGAILRSLKDADAADIGAAIAGEA